MEQANWLRLDNSANLWPAIMNQRYTSLFRLAARFKHLVRVDLLQKALEEVLPTFPYFQVEMRGGFFWNMLVRRHDFPRIEPDVANPCMNQHLKRPKAWLFRIRVYGPQLAIEFSHALTDGTGAQEFLKQLVMRYLDWYSSEGGDTGELPPPFSLAGGAPQSWEDPAPQLAHQKPPSLAPQDEAWHEPHHLEAPGYYRVIHGFVPVDEILVLAKACGITLTEYITALIMDIYQDLALEAYEKGRTKSLKPIRVLIPVNLRTVFHSKTLRNFFVFSDPTIDPRLGRHSFEEICATVMHTLRRQSQPTWLYHRLSSYVREQSMIYRRIMPLWVKNLAISFVYALRGDTRFTSSVSNLGRVELPEQYRNHLSAWLFTPPPNPIGKTNMSIVSLGNKLCITFGAMHRNSDLACRFFRRLSSQGLAVHIESNDEPIKGEAKP